MACDPQSLITQAVCDLCIIPAGMQLPVMISLLCQVRDALGNVGISSGAGAPTFTPSTTTAIYFDTNTGAQYNYYAGAWH